MLFIVMMVHLDEFGVNIERIEFIEQPIDSSLNRVIDERRQKRNDPEPNRHGPPGDQSGEVGSFGVEKFR